MQGLFGISRRFALAAALGAATLLQAAEPTTVLLVRHAEKAAEPASDPPLTPAGKKRALALVDTVRGAGIDAILSTEKLRTRQTVAPTAKLLGLEPQIVPMDDINGMAAAIWKLQGKTVLVGSHSGDSIELIEKLGAGKLPKLADHHYDNLFVITVEGPGKARVLRLKYGVPTP